MTTLEHRTNTGTHPNKFALYIGIGALVMLFAGLTSAYIIQHGDRATWFSIRLPQVFQISTAMIVLSSLTIWIAMRSYKRNNLGTYRLWILTTLILGLGFCLTQYLGWQDMRGREIFLNGHPNGSFIYVITGIHVVHVLAGIIALIYLVIFSLVKYKQNSDLALDKAKSDRPAVVSNIAVYWHFVDILWIYLFFFFTYLNS